MKLGHRKYKNSIIFPINSKEQQKTDHSSLLRVVTLAPSLEGETGWVKKEVGGCA